MVATTARTARFAPRTLTIVVDRLRALRASVARCAEALRNEVADALSCRDLSDLFDQDDGAMRVYGGLEWKQRCWLLGERDRLKDLLDKLRAAAISRSDFEPHDITDDEADIQADAIRGRLAAIDEALDRINSDRYGLCQMCGSAIPLGRLEALPTTAVCRGCAG